MRPMRLRNFSAADETEARQFLRSVADAIAHGRRCIVASPGDWKVGRVLARSPFFALLVIGVCDRAEFIEHAPPGAVVSDIPGDVTFYELAIEARTAPQ